MDIVKFAASCLEDEAKAIIDLIPRLGESFIEAVDLIQQCKGKVIVTGVGKSGHVGEKIAATLASLGTPSFFLNPLDAYHGDLGMVADNDIIIAISYSGNTDELLRLFPLFIERKIPIIGMCGNRNSLLVQYSSCHLDISVDHEVDPLNLAPTSSTTTTIAMGDALACTLSKLRNFRSCDFAKFHPGGNLGKRLLTKVKDVMYKNNLPILHSGDTIIKALDVIGKGRFGLAIVLDEQRIEGLMTSGDLRRAFQKNGPNSFNLLVKDCMNRSPKTIYQNCSLTDAAELFQETNVNILVVVNENLDFVGFVESKDCIN